MTQSVKVNEDKAKEFKKKPQYLVEIEEKWDRWTEIKDPEVREAIKDLTGDLWTEMRKLEALLCKDIENRGFPEEFKDYVKSLIRDCWRDIVGHQKIGMDKLGIVVRKYIKQ